jgi:GNAT superfamily N-acetyltransferase
MGLADLVFRRLAPRDDPPETLVLDDGRTVVVRPITPDAKPLIAEAITRVSPESSRRRFLTVRRQLSERELDQLTRLDGWHRYALGAVERGPAGVRGVAVARFARLADDPRAAEIAILVVDAWQGAGLGRHLLDRLANAARLRGIERFTGLVLADNAPMLGMLRRHAPGLALARDGDQLSIDVPVPESRGGRPSLGTALASLFATPATPSRRNFADARA